MGFERLCMVLQGKQSNYDTDVFQPTIRRLAELSGKFTARIAGPISRCGWLPTTCGRCFLDCRRATAVEREGRYVIRRILRRAVRYGYTYSVSTSRLSASWSTDSSGRWANSSNWRSRICIYQ